MIHTQATRLILLLIMAEAVSTSAMADHGVTSSQPVFLNDSSLTESSGLAVSWRNKNRFWTHNDSGGKPRLYAFDHTGQKTGQCHLKSADHDDWEDMASFTQDGIARLLVADCGDNDAKRDSVCLYLIDEPDTDRSTETGKLQELSITFPDGPRNCEAVAVDPRRGQIVLVAKSHLPFAGVYVVALPPRATESTGKTKSVASRIGSVPIPMITSMDIDPANGDIWLVSYFHAFRLECQDRDEPIGRQLTRLAPPQELPRWKQIEAVAVDRDSAIWITSEGSPAPLGRLKFSSQAVK